FILQDENLVPDLIKRAYKHNNASSYLLVKGEKDYVANREGIIGVIDSPNIETLEPIGGTGDTLTGVVSALIASGMDIESASAKAAKVNRLAGLYADPTPATQVYEIIKQIPRALEEVLRN
ncbi:MAG: sugar kinase, partial [Clostridiales bacterium]|nr:sugar kinase [Clostridiales bacterium]